MKNFLAQASGLPKPYSTADASQRREQWQALAGRQDKALAAWMRQEALAPVLDSVFGNSPYLSRLLLLYPDVLRDLAMQGADAAHVRLKDLFAPGGNQAELMRSLRVAKGRLALLVALADMTGCWTLPQVTGALSEFAETALQLAVDVLLRAAHKRGEIVLSQESGVVVLGMGKLGSGELNYSSDIDLVFFFEPEQLGYKGWLSEQHFMNRLVYDLVAIMQERNRDGYVFRTDVRLRPDPASMPPAIATGTAYAYYENVGQNWERAAMIKARPVAGDIAAGDRFLKGIAPFMWRRNLDFAAIDDIHSIKRQMDSRRSREIQVKGHNIKLGQGGIREIEFYVQIHQLIWGGREPMLRVRATCEALSRLAQAKLVDDGKALWLADAYAFLRKLEHRLQMIADEQTHTLPESDAGLAHVACFMGYDDVRLFEKDTLRILAGVHEIYASSFKSAENLGGEGRLVFTGVTHDPDTLDTLRRMGYSQPERISEIVMGWHHGATRATRTKRARELLTELMPILLNRLSETANPDAAFLKFNEFLSHLPAGVQLFTLFSANPHLLTLIADVMGSAPTLAEHLSRSPELLDTVLAPDFYAALPLPQQVEQQLTETLASADDFERRMEALRCFRNEKQFQAGVQMLRGMIDARQAGHFLSLLADAVIGRAQTAVLVEFTRVYGHIDGGHFATIALGKLGSREMTFSSDIDLVFVYDAPADARSNGEKSLGASEYFNRLAQRCVNALATMGRHGRLYEVDTRLRPSGKQGLLAVSADTLAHYFRAMAWTFEAMAFTKARIISGDVALKQRLDDFIRGQLSKPRDLNKLHTDAADMRGRIHKEYGSADPWNIKYVRGGLIDIDFIAEYLLLRHAPDMPGAKTGGALEIFEWLKQNGRLEAGVADALAEADCFLGQIFNILRLCSDHAFDEAAAPSGLKKLLAESVKEKDFASLKKKLIRVEEWVFQYYREVMNPANRDAVVRDILQ
ncbi:MAG: bifunctional [glutamine synthetase] adenylyltransferase/[glutamine synthetase]-adenylyl-L-tyrosine phosphorylase [Pseudomonadota bacterium]|nr:bifunctional [glutamine synthetase] adenylyltransferase/[glutamine synthetase]-adenylyl-L-tyrosine phosphorylase [Pseudomonadota bacterium]MDE3037590.1 bifunctional [glutamine synthetase] adenylyltransferase/[glutamine synthetase]-adenylyl-L-tyrosine phosphorylase [Pseudomonadota bacterium]